MSKWQVKSIQALGLVILYVPLLYDFQKPYRVAGGLLGLALIFGGDFLPIKPVGPSDINGESLKER